MASALFQGILRGIAGAHQENRTKLFEMEQSRRKNMADFLLRESSNPNRLPESQAALQQQYFELATMGPEKKLPKDFESRALQSIMKTAPELGDTGWQGGETQRTIEAQPMTVPGGAPEPEPIPLSAPVPPPPEGYSRSPFYTPGEKINIAGKEAYQNAYQTAAGRAAGTPPEPLKHETYAFGTDSTGIADRATGRVIREPQAPDVPNSAASIQEYRLYESQELTAGRKPMSYKDWVSFEANARQQRDPASALLLQSATSIPYWADKVQSGEVDMAAVPYYMKDAVMNIVGQSGNRIVPRAIRDRIADIQSSRNLLTPIKNLVKQIDATKDYTQKVTLSVQLENYMRSVGTTLARNVGGERGVVTNQDRDAAIGLVPGWKAANFAPGFAQEKLQLLEGVIDAQDRVLREGYFNPLPNQSSAPAPPGAGGGAGQFKAGEVVTYNGKQYTVVGTNPDGTLELEAVK